ncbi:MAG: hypothetical protein V4735_09170 [Pseudomonadota bacterium]
MPPLPIIQAPARIQFRNGRGNNSAQYQDTRVAIHHGEPAILFPGDFVRYLLDRQEISLKEFDEKIGCAHSYFTNNIFNTGSNNGSRPLPEPLQEKMIALTGTQTSRALWMQKNFTAADAEGITIDMSRDISGIVERYAKYSHYKKAPAANDDLQR